MHKPRIIRTLVAVKQSNEDTSTVIGDSPEFQEKGGTLVNGVPSINGYEGVDAVSFWLEIPVEESQQILARRDLAIETLRQLRDKYQE